MLMRPALLTRGLSILRPQDVFATDLYTGTGSNQSIVNSLNFAGQGGLLWLKQRSSQTAASHFLLDTARGASNYLSTDATGAEANNTLVHQSFDSNGYTLGSNSTSNGNGRSNVGWSFLRKARFLDIVRYTGDGTSNRQIPHNLGVKPGMIVVKRRDGVSNWLVNHQSLNTGQFLLLNTTGAAQTDTTAFPSNPTDTVFSVGSAAGINASGGTYVAYLFAHDPTGIIQCGTYTTDANGAATVNLGWMPQFLLVKCVDDTGGWFIFDTVRGWTTGSGKYLQPNTTAAEANDARATTPTATGFSTNNFGQNTVANSKHIFMAIKAAA